MKWVIATLVTIFVYFLASFGFIFLVAGNEQVERYTGLFGLLVGLLFGYATLLSYGKKSSKDD